MLLFLGAGASNPFGIPTMQGFVELFDKEVGQIPLYSSIRSTFANNCDLEVIMTIVEDLTKSSDEFFRTISPQTAFFLLQKERNDTNRFLREASKKEAKALLINIKTIIREKCLAAATDDSKILKAYDDFFDFIAKINNKMKPEKNFHLTEYSQSCVLPTSLNIFTTNYDTCLEVYFNRREMDFSKGILHRYGEDLFDVSEYSSPQSQNKVAKIYKLHGSIDLFRVGRKIKLLTTAGTDKTFLGEKRGEESMRWPIEFGGYRHVIESPYLDLFRLFRDVASNDNWWVFIGFSFRDRTICSLLNDLLELKSKTGRPNALLINCHPKTTITRLREWNYQAIAETLIPVKAEFGNKDLSAKIQGVLGRKHFIQMPF